MNKLNYKIIFNRTLNRLVVVSELAKSVGKAVACALSSGVNFFQHLTALFVPFARPQAVSRLYLAVMMSLGLVFVQDVFAEEPQVLQIRPDKSVAGNLQPQVLSTANGIPQVNIQTPSAAGVSRNVYSQFDVDKKGAVLNNARKAAATQTAGWVQGNPNLARGEAKVILNEVNAVNPSQLQGYVEVAGKKADVVIANPSGIHCDGCGVINAGRATFTTGKADVQNGELRGFDVRGGRVSIGKNGLDSRADYTDIIAERAEIDGGVWAKQLAITTGKNRVNSSNDDVVYVGENAQSAVENEKNLYAVDVSALGGMYAEHIKLVDNGSGLGVRNAGYIGASAGDVAMDSQGRIVNSGTIHADQKANLNASDIDNRSGKIIAKQTALQAKTVDNQGQSLIYGAKQVKINAQKVNNSHSKSLSAIPNQGILGEHVSIDAETLNNQDGGIYSANAVNIRSSSELTNQQGEILASDSVRVVDNQPARKLRVDNQDGVISAGRLVKLQAKTLVNEGDISSQGDGEIDLQDDFTLRNAFRIGNNLTFHTTGNFINQTQLRVGNGLQLTARRVENTANADVELSAKNTHISTALLNNKGLIDGENTWLDTTTLNNLGTGRIYGDHLAVAATELNNLNETTVNADGQTENHAATIAARSNLDLGVGVLTNRNHSQILSLDKMTIGGSLNEQHQATGSAQLIDNGSATIEALGSGVISATKLWNHDIHLKLGTKTEKNQYIKYSPFNSSAEYFENIDGSMDWNNGNRHDDNAYWHLNNGTTVASPNWHTENYTRTNITDTIEHRDPAKILMGENVTLNGGTFINDKSQFLVGKNLFLGKSLFGENPTNQTLSAGLTKLENIDLIGEIHRYDDGYSEDITAERHHHHGHRVYGHYGQGKHIFHRNLPVETFNFNIVDNRIGETVTTENTHISNRASASVPTEQISILPDNSLYQIKTAAPQGYIVETDPQFTDKKTMD